MNDQESEGLYAIRSATLAIQTVLFHSAMTGKLSSEQIKQFELHAEKIKEYAAGIRKGDKQNTLPRLEDVE